MVMYTKQNSLGRFGKRWGCLATDIISIIETELGRRLSRFELDACVGRWHRSEHVLVCNYKHHEILFPEPGGWESAADPEWHFLIFDKDGNKAAGRNAALYDLMDLFGIVRS